MKVSLIQICESCGHEVQELLEERFQNWVWHKESPGNDFRVRLGTTPQGLEEEGKKLIFELRLTMDERDTKVAR
jgi:hypothetical protein